MKPVPDCVYLSTCIIFERFRVEGSESVWIGGYCRGPMQEECVRKKLRDAGKPVAVTMLPNGQNLPTLTR
jgi:hypothetical protein